MIISVCEVQDLHDLTNLEKEITLKNTKYMTFPYVMYKMNTILPLSNKLRKYYESYIFHENDGSYLIFKYRFDIEYLKEEAFEDNNESIKNVFINLETAIPYITPEILEQVYKLNIDKNKILILGE